MVREVFDKYPDYLQGFAYIEELKSWQWLVVSAFCNQIENMLEEVKMEFSWYGGECWGRFLQFPPNINPVEGVKKLHQRYGVTTLDILKSYISCWIDEDNFTMEYDSEAMSVTIKAVKRIYYEEYYDKIRNVIPCNMLLVIETVEDLG